MYDSEGMLILEDLLDAIDRGYPEGPYNNSSECTALLQAQELDEWRQWYVDEYPHTNPRACVGLHGTFIDIRILFMAEPAPAYSILLYVRACYEIDRVLCSNGANKLESISQWQIPQNMMAYGYLLSDEVMDFWEFSLTKLGEEILSKTSSRASINGRMRRISRALRQLDFVWGVICAEPWRGAVRSGNRNLGGQLQGPFFLPPEVLDSMCERRQFMAMSLKVLQEELDRPTPIISIKSAIPQNRSMIAMTKGILSCVYHRVAT